MKELNKNIGNRHKIIDHLPPADRWNRQRGLNQELEQYLRMFVDYRQTNWPEWLAIAEFSYNNKIQKSIKISPFYANYGFNPRMGFEPRRDVKVQAVEEFCEGVEENTGGG